MSRYEFCLAVPADEPELRARMAQDVLEGNISVSFRREPNYFSGLKLMGDEAQVLVCKDKLTGRLVCMGARIKRRAYINGHETVTGYLADMRSAPDVRGQTLLARGFKALRGLHEIQPLALSSTVILEGNLQAIESLTKHRAGLPFYRLLGRMHTPALHLDMPRRVPVVVGVTVRMAQRADAEALCAFLRREHAKKQFAPVWDLAALSDESNAARLKVTDFWLAFMGDEIVGAMAAWNQECVRQTHIERYSKTLKYLRPFYNAMAMISPLKPLPAVGARVPYVYFSALASKNNDPAIFAQLLATVCNALHRSPWHYAICGLHEDDALLEVVRQYRRIDAAGLLYVVHYPEDQAVYESMDGRVPYVDFGMI